MAAAAVLIALVSDGGPSEAQPPLEAASVRQSPPPVKIDRSKWLEHRSSNGFAAEQYSRPDRPEPVANEPAPGIDQQESAMPAAGTNLAASAVKPSEAQIARLIAQSEVRSGAPGDE